MITSVVAAIAISQREARRKKAEQEAELLAASQKSILIVSGGTSGLATAFVLCQYGFTVTIVDEREDVDVDEGEEGVVVVPAMTIQLLVKGGLLEPNQALADELKEAGGVENITYRRYKSSKALSTTPLSSETALVIPAEELYILLTKHTPAQLHKKAKIISYHDAPEDLDGPLPTGRPYALASNGQKFYADIIIVCRDGGIARSHVCATADIQAPALKESGWCIYSGFVDREEHPSMREGANTWVGEDSFCTGYTTEDEWVFSFYHLSDVEDIPKHIKSWAPEVREAIAEAGGETERHATILPPPSTSVSRKSRKILLFGGEGFRLPPLSPHLTFAMLIESAATLAVCLRKAASVPLALEVYSRLRASRIEDAFEMGMKRLRTITESAEAEELEADEVKWDCEGPWWEFNAEKVADEKFEVVIEMLTQELLGKQKAMLEAQARAAQEEGERAAAAEASTEKGDETGRESTPPRRTEQDQPPEKDGQQLDEDESEDGESPEEDSEENAIQKSIKSDAAAPTSPQNQSASPAPLSESSAGETKAESQQPPEKSTRSAYSDPRTSIEGARGTTPREGDPGNVDEESKLQKEYPPPCLAQPKTVTNPDREGSELHPKTTPTVASKPASPPVTAHDSHIHLSPPASAATSRKYNQSPKKGSVSNDKPSNIESLPETVLTRDVKPPSVTPLMPTTAPVEPTSSFNVTHEEVKTTTELTLDDTPKIQFDKLKTDKEVEDVTSQPPDKVTSAVRERDETIGFEDQAARVFDKNLITAEAGALGSPSTPHPAKPKVEEKDIATNGRDGSSVSSPAVTAPPSRPKSEPHATNVSNPRPAVAPTQRSRRSLSIGPRLRSLIGGKASSPENPASSEISVSDTPKAIPAVPPIPPMPLPPVPPIPADDAPTPKSETGRGRTPPRRSLSIGRRMRSAVGGQGTSLRRVVSEQPEPANQPRRPSLAMTEGGQTTKETNGGSSVGRGRDTRRRSFDIRPRMRSFFGREGSSASGVGDKSGVLDESSQNGGTDASNPPTADHGRNGKGKEKMKKGFSFMGRR